MSNFLFEGPENLFRFSGHFEYKAWIAGLTTIGGARVGKQVISFKDGGLISIKDPCIEIGVLTNKNNVIVGKLEVIDHINKLVGTVTYNPRP